MEKSQRNTLFYWCPTLTYFVKMDIFQSIYFVHGTLQFGSGRTCYWDSVKHTCSCMTRSFSIYPVLCPSKCAAGDYTSSLGTRRVTTNSCKLCNANCVCHGNIPFHVVVVVNEDAACRTTNKAGEQGGGRKMKVNTLTCQHLIIISFYSSSYCYCCKYE